MGELLELADRGRVVEERVPAGRGVEAGHRAQHLGFEPLGDLKVAVGLVVLKLGDGLAVLVLGVAGGVHALSGGGAATAGAVGAFADRVEPFAVGGREGGRHEGAPGSSSIVSWNTCPSGVGWFRTLMSRPRSSRSCATVNCSRLSASCQSC